MPQFEFLCGSCATRTEQTFPIGTARRLMTCPECGGAARLVIGAGVQIAPSALESKGAQVRKSNENDSKLDKDRSAYLRMRHRGIQPDHVDGSAHLENYVGDTFDATYRPRFERLSKDKWDITKRRIQEGVAEVKEAEALSGNIFPTQKVGK